MPRATLLALAILTALAAPAAALSMRTDLEPMAWSDDGAAVLMRVNTRGPEGGGVLDFQIWSASSPHRSAFVLSSTLNDGGGSKQQVAPADCAARAKALGQAFKERGFRGVAVHADRCGKKVGDLVTVDAKQKEVVTAARFTAKGGKLAHGGLEVRFRGGEIGLYRDEHALCTLTQPKRDAPAELFVAGGNSGRLVYVIERTSSGDEGLLGLCGGDGKTLAPLPLK